MKVYLTQADIVDGHVNVWRELVEIEPCQTAVIPSWVKGPRKYQWCSVCEKLIEEETQTAIDLGNEEPIFVHNKCMPLQPEKRER